MKLVDTNVLLRAVNADDRAHEVAVRWLEAALSGDQRVGLAWVALLGFVRVSTHPNVFEHPLEATEALDVVAEWLDHPRTTVVEPTERHLALVRSFLEAEGTAANLTTDAHLAALAVEHGATVVTFDRDFARFDGVAHERPTA